MFIRNLAILAFFALYSFGFVSCKSTCCGEPSARGMDTVRLAEWMTGSFSSTAQSIEQPDDYFDIRLFMVPIWTGRTDGEWLYVEQAIATKLEKPYRQRVYHLVGTELGIRSEVYELPGDPLQYAGSYDRPADFDAFGPDELTLREGCSIHLVDHGDSYSGSTLGTGCSSSLGDAQYATSEVTITPEALTSWDRGFDKDGHQAWGAEKGPYVFMKE